MFQKQLNTYIKDAVERAFELKDVDVHIEHPANLEHGDYSTNIAFRLAKDLKQSPMEIAKKVVYELNNILEEEATIGENTNIFSEITLLQPGFINFYLSKNWLLKVPGKVMAANDSYGSSDFWNSKMIMVEYTDPNPLKVFHIGHLMTNAIGESVARIFEFTGADVKRANYQGDVGMHVAKSIWGLIKSFESDGLNMDKIGELPLEERIVYFGKSYALGALAFNEDSMAKEEMQNLNTILFDIAQQYQAELGTLDPQIDYKRLLQQGIAKYDHELLKDLYIKGRAWSLEYFETLYKRLGTSFDYYFFESFVADIGYGFVMDNIENGVFEKDAGAVIYKGEKDGLHTRVFINSLGLPVYEAKDLGLAFLKYEKYPYDKSFIITANEVNTYFSVVLKAMEKINPALAEKTVHLGHGMMRFKDRKMSSRTGDVVAGDELLNELRDTVLHKMATTETTNVPSEDQATVADTIAVAAIKYLVLKNGLGNDIVFDKDEMLGLVGNTGPYLLYTYARTQSVLGNTSETSWETRNLDLHSLEMDLLRHIYKFGEVVLEASENISPNVIATFAFELSQKYNSFYAELPIIKAENREDMLFRLSLTASVGQILKNSLNLLGIKVVDRM